MDYYNSEEPNALRVFTLAHLPPHILAYAMARYSRSDGSMLDSIQWIKDSVAKSEKFHQTYYYNYGHRSIADMAQIPMAVENVSMLAAIYAENNRLWNGQERSTRYQDFTSTADNSNLVVPPEFKHTEHEEELEKLYFKGMNNLLLANSEMVEEVYRVLSLHISRPADMSEAAYERSLYARAFDVSRSLLPYGLKTSFGQVISARAMEDQLGTMTLAPYQEVQELAQWMKIAATTLPAYSPLGQELVDRATMVGEDSPDAAQAYLEIADKANTEIAGKGLVKYSNNVEQYKQIEEEARRLVEKHTYKRKAAVDNNYVTRIYVNTDSLQEELAATILYRYSHMSYRQCRLLVDDWLSDHEIEELARLAYRFRGEHDGIVREAATGYRYIVDVMLDGKSMQDFYRHRNCIQVRQDITWMHGFEEGDKWMRLGLPVKVYPAIKESGMAELYDTHMKSAIGNSQPLLPLLGNNNRKWHSLDYMMPMGYRQRALFKMDAAQLQYMIETRATKAGHFSYRRAALEMYKSLLKKQSYLYRHTRSDIYEYNKPPTHEDILKRH